MKQCSKCTRVWPLSHYQVRSAEQGTYRGVCRACRRLYNASYYMSNAGKYKEFRRQNQPRYRQQRRELLLGYLQGKRCLDCGEADVLVLEFDHVRGKKTADVATMLSHYCWARIVEELEKCEIRCANCHRRKTARDFKWFKGNFGA